MTRAPWATLLAFAVTKERCDLPATDAPDPALVLEELRGRGEDPRARARALRDSGEPWPVPLPQDLRAQVPSFAQYTAALQQTVELLALDEPHLRATRPLDADERRLLADRPPHWGRVR